MGKVDLPDPPKTPDPIADNVTDKLAQDLMKDKQKTKKGMRASMLTRGQRTSKRSESLLGKTDSKLG